MPTVRCPDCGAAVELPEGVKSGDLVECPNCAGSALRMRAADGGWVATLAYRVSCPACDVQITLPEGTKAGDTIGDINEIILTNDGSAAAAVIGVGGFLGMGEHQVAVQFKSLKIDRHSNGNDVIMLDTTKDALKQAPEWTWQST